MLIKISLKRRIHPLISMSVLKFNGLRARKAASDDGVIVAYMYKESILTQYNTFDFSFLIGPYYYIILFLMNQFWSAHSSDSGKMDGLILS